jgi:cyanophycinase
VKKIQIFPKWILLLCIGAAASAHAQSHAGYRVGNAQDVATIPEAGFALMGGGKDLDAAFQWLARRANGGDFLVLRAHGNDDYNAYIQPFAKLNSVATLVIPSRQAADDPVVAQTIAKADAIFIAGGDQANYINFWKDTPVQAALNDALRRGVPIGGTSAGLAVMGEYIYSAQNDKLDGPDLTSAVALKNPFDPQVIIVRGFLDNALLANTITDTHFSVRDRMGRLLVFMARIRESGVGMVEAIAVDQGAAVLLDATGKAAVVGGAAYLLRSSQKAMPVKSGEPLTFGPVEAQKLRAGDSFDVKVWKGPNAAYTYTVKDGMVHSSLSGGTIY